MTIDELKRAGLGVFWIVWADDGGHSVASIGQTENGDRWIAPANWLSPMMPSSKNYLEHVEGIAELIPIHESLATKLEELAEFIRDQE